VIGKKGTEIQNLKKELEDKIKREFFIDIQEVRKPEVDAQLLAEISQCARKKGILSKGNEKA
jgi:small subunit ribosomal protein S3